MIKVAFIKDHLEYKSANDEVETMQRWVELHTGDRPCEWTITEKPEDVLQGTTNFDLVLIDYGGAWWNRSYDSAIRLDRMFSPFAQWAVKHPGTLVVLATTVTSMFFEELSESWLDWPDNIVKHQPSLDEEAAKLESWFKSL